MGGVYSGRVACRFLREGWVDYVSVAYSGEEGGIFWRDGEFWEGHISKGGGIFWEGGVDSGRDGGIDSRSIAYSCRKGGYILERWGRFWEPHLI